MKAIEQYFHVVLFIMLYKVVLTFRCVNMQVKVILWYFHIYFNLIFAWKEFQKSSNVLFGYKKNHFSENSVQYLINFAD